MWYSIYHAWPKKSSIEFELPCCCLFWVEAASRNRLGHQAPTSYPQTESNRGKPASHDPLPFEWMWTNASHVCLWRLRRISKMLILSFDWYLNSYVTMWYNVHVIDNLWTILDLIHWLRYILDVSCWMFEKKSLAEIWTCKQSSSFTRGPLRWRHWSACGFTCTIMKPRWWWAEKREGVAVPKEWVKPQWKPFCVGNFHVVFPRCFAGWREWRHWLGAFGADFRRVWTGLSFLVQTMTKGDIYEVFNRTLRTHTY